MTLPQWVMVMRAVPPEARGEKYSAWRRDKVLSEKEICAIEKQLPAVSVPIPVSPQVGLGDLVKKVTDSLGIRQCGKCEKRQDEMNKFGDKVLTFLQKLW